MEFFLKGISPHEPLIKLASSSSNLIKNNTTLLDTIHEQISSIFSLAKDEFYLTSSRGVKLGAKSSIQNRDILCLCPKVYGGKGGFGSLLRAFGKQITLSTNKEACRDLTGRRIRHVNNEKKLREFLQNQKEIEKEKELKKQEKLERRKRKREKLESTHHLFLDPNYDKQKQIIAKDLDEALGKAVAGGQRKRKLISSADPEQDNAENPKVNIDSNEKRSSGNEEIEELKTPLLVQTTSSALIAKLDVKKKVDEKELEKKKEKQLESLKGWMGVDDLDVSSSDDDGEEKDEPPKKSLKSM